MGSGALGRLKRNLPRKNLFLVSALMRLRWRMRRKQKSMIWVCTTFSTHLACWLVGSNPRAFGTLMQGHIELMWSVASALSFWPVGDSKEEGGERGLARFVVVKDRAVQHDTPGASIDHE